MAKKPTWLIWPALAAVVLIWGSTWLIIKLGLGSFPPFTFAGLRYLAAAFVLLALSKLTRASFPDSWRGWIFLVSVGVLTVGFTHALIFWGEQYISSGLTGLLWATNPFLTALVAHFFIPAETINLRRLSGIVLGFVGVLIVLVEPILDSGRFDLVAVLAIVAASATWAAGSVWFKKANAPGSPMVASGIQMLTGGIILSVIAASLERGQTVTFSVASVSLLIYFVLMNTCLAFTLFFWLLKHTEATIVSLTAFLNPIVAVLLGAIVLSERLSWPIALGLPLVGLGLFMVQKPTHPRRRADLPAVKEEVADLSRELP